jgi:hypothetical protein
MTILALRITDFLVCFATELGKLLSIPFSSNFSLIVLPLLPLSFDSNFKVAKVDNSGTGPGIYQVLLKKKMKKNLGR